jgi:phage host-nuclease inhibitor protein Gam
MTTATSARKGRAKTAAPDVSVPQSRDEVAAAIGAIGQHMRDRVLLEAAMAEEIAAVRARYEGMAEPHGLAISTLTKGVEIWCAANRDALTDSGKRKMATFTTGEVRWRMTPPKVSVRNPEDVLQQLHALGGEKFIRTAEEVNKEAILADPTLVVGIIRGVSISQREEFEVLPHQDALAGGTS